MEQLNSNKTDEGIILDDGGQAIQPERQPSATFPAERSALKDLPRRVVDGQVFVSIPIRPQVRRQIINSSEE